MCEEKKQDQANVGETEKYTAEEERTQSEEKFSHAEAFKEFGEKLDQASEELSRQYAAAAKKLDEHIRSEEFQQKKENLRKAASNLNDEITDGVVLASEGVRIIAGDVLRGVNAALKSLGEMFNQDEEESSQSAEEEIKNQPDESNSIDIEWKDDEKKD